MGFSHCWLLLLDSKIYELWRFEGLDSMLLKIIGFALNSLFFFFNKSMVFVVHSFKWILFTLNKAALELLKLAKNRDVEWSANPPLLGGDSQFGSPVTNWGWGFHSWTWHWGFNFDVGGIDFCLDNGFLCEGYTVYLFDWNIDIYSVCANNCVSPIHKCF